MVPGAWLAGFTYLTTLHCYILNIEAVGPWFQKFFFKVIEYYPLYGKSMEAKDPEGLVNLEPRGMVGRIYVGDHQTLLYSSI